MNTFTESQRFRQPWLWVGLASVNLVMGLGVWVDPTAWSGLVVGLLIALLFYVWRLDTRMDSEGIHYRVLPLIPRRTISWNAVKSVTVDQYGFVGYGIRWSSEGWVYNVAGSKGLRVVFSNNRQIILGTQRPDELQKFLDQQYIQHE